MQAELITKPTYCGSYFGSEPLTSEQIMVAIARVSSDKEPEERGKDAEKLLVYCLKNGHWSVFEHGYFTVRVQTTLAIATQLLRHRSFTFQQFSQRYNAQIHCEPGELRVRAGNNRQGSGGKTEDMALYDAVGIALDAAFDVYNTLIDSGIAPECARQVLPQCTVTELFITGNARSWIHYLQQRLSEHAQKEHQWLAHAIADVLRPEMPIIFKHFGF